MDVFWVQSKNCRGLTTDSVAPSFCSDPKYSKYVCPDFSIVCRRGEGGAHGFNVVTLA